MSPEPDDGIPTLTDVVSLERPSLSEEPPSEETLSEETLAALHADLSSAVLAAAEELLQAARQQIEAVLFEQVLVQLRERLPDLIDQALRERLGERLPPSSGR